MKKVIVLLTLLMVLLYAFKVVKAEEVIIPDTAIRLRVLANSNTIKDQQLKIKVRDKIQEELYKNLDNIENVDEARSIIEEEIPKLNGIIKEVLEKNNSNLKYKIEFTNYNFPEKKYKGLIYKEGIYETLLITLGNGNGNNWWCVLFPPLCLIETEEKLSLIHI